MEAGTNDTPQAVCSILTIISQNKKSLSIRLWWESIIILALIWFQWRWVPPHCSVPLRSRPPLGLLSPCAAWASSWRTWTRLRRYWWGCCYCSHHQYAHSHRPSWLRCCSRLKCWWSGCCGFVPPTSDGYSLDRVSWWSSWRSWNRRIARNDVLDPTAPPCIGSMCCSRNNSQSRSRKWNKDTRLDNATSNECTNFGNSWHF